MFGPTSEDLERIESKVKDGSKGLQLPAEVGKRDKTFHPHLFFLIDMGRHAKKEQEKLSPLSYANIELAWLQPKSWGVLFQHPTVLVLFSWQELSFSLVEKRVHRPSGVILPWGLATGEKVFSGRSTGQSKLLSLVVDGGSSLGRCHQKSHPTGEGN